VLLVLWSSAWVSGVRGENNTICLQALVAAAQLADRQSERMRKKPVRRAIFFNRPSWPAVTEAGDVVVPIARPGSASSSARTDVGLLDAAAVYIDLC
jgi:hypothetical protein